ncbi:MAG: DHH family phosphoesterase [Patescibacteria group bacterium]
MPPVMSSNVLTKSLTGRRWVFREQASGTAALRSPELLVTNLAIQRGIDLEHRPTFETLSDPFLLGDMEEAVLRIHHAIARGETVGIVGDYDADGITGVAQLVRFFRRHQQEPLVILPHREKDGYGLKREFISVLHEAGATLLITVDTGIGATEKISEARSLRMDVIVLDHHSLSEELPDALLVHPLLSTVKSQMSTVHLCASGVVFTLLRALAGRGTKWEGWNEDVALAAIGTVADVVPLLQENRSIVTLGLQALNDVVCHAEQPELREGVSKHPLFDLVAATRRKDESLTSMHLGFRIAPRINAAGRMADPKIALRALLEGGWALEEIVSLNEERQEETFRLLEIAEEKIQVNNFSIALESSEFHLGIVGLIAGKLTERYGRPSLIGSRRGEQITCSLRSIPEYHIAEALGRMGPLLLTHGGHAKAGGCTLQLAEWEKLKDAFEQDVRTILKGEEPFPTLTVDGELFPSDIFLALTAALSALEPYGEGNREPRFLLRNQTLSSARGVGNEGRHLQCMVSGIKAIGFNLGSLLPKLPPTVDLVCRIGVDTWQGNVRPQLFIEDIAESKAAPANEPELVIVNCR